MRPSLLASPPSRGRLTQRDQNMSVWMTWMRHFSIRLRMQGAIAMVLGLLALVAGGGLYGILSLQKARMISSRPPTRT